MAESIKEYLDNLPNWAKVGLGLAAAAIPVAIVVLKKPRRSPVKADWKKDIVYLYQFPRSPAIPNLSPFCLKVETWLRMVGLQDQYEVCDEDMWVRSREGKLPFVEVNGKEYPDSSFIIRDLMKMFDKGGNEALMSTEAKGAARAIEQMTEGSLLQSYAYVRYGDHAEELFGENIMGKNVNFLVRMFGPGYVSRKVRGSLAISGIGMHERKEVIGIGLDDLKALSNYLGSRQFFANTDKPTRVDATVFGTLAQILYLPIDTEHKRFIVAECQNLIAFCDRIKQTYWPDWDRLERTPIKKGSA
jgi:glutathione S-transferase